MLGQGRGQRAWQARDRDDCHSDTPDRYDPRLRLEVDWARSAAAAGLDRIAAEIRPASASQNMKRSSSAWAEAVGWLSSREYLFLLGPTVDHHDPFALDMP